MEPKFDQRDLVVDPLEYAFLCPLVPVLHCQQTLEQRTIVSLTQTPCSLNADYTKQKYTEPNGQSKNQVHQDKLQKKASPKGQ
jgi:hypothetical protein